MDLLHASERGAGGWGPHSLGHEGQANGAAFPPMKMERVHVKITGRVQGVFFRANAQEKAESLGLAGWVRNTPDGGVEAVAEGECENLTAFAKWCGHGPPSAKVVSTDTEWLPATGEFHGFIIR